MPLIKSHCQKLWQTALCLSGHPSISRQHHGFAVKFPQCCSKSIMTTRAWRVMKYYVAVIFFEVASNYYFQVDLILPGFFPNRLSRNYAPSMHLSHRQIAGSFPPPLHKNALTQIKLIYGPPRSENFTVQSAISPASLIEKS